MTSGNSESVSRPLAILWSLSQYIDYDVIVVGDADALTDTQGA